MRAGGSVASQIRPLISYGRVWKMWRSSSGSVGSAGCAFLSVVVAFAIVLICLVL